ncbi:maestro heat-like repeat-containing protein family member 7 [Liasis olivaceus]
MVEEFSSVKLKPPLDPNVRSELVNKSIQKVFSLPALKMTKVKANSPAQPVQTQDFYQQTITACNSMLASLLSEAPSLESLQDILMHTNIWIDSPTNYERERAIKSTRHLLKFVSEHFDFDTTGEFPMLGQLVALLALHIADSVREIGQASAEATYHLHYIIMNKMGEQHSGGRLEGDRAAHCPEQHRSASQKTINCDIPPSYFLEYS